MTHDGADLDELARAFTVRMQGPWRDADAAAFARSARKDTSGDDDAGVTRALDRARIWFHEHPSELFVCGGRACRNRLRRVSVLEARASKDTAGPLRMAITDGHGPCKQAPVATLRVATRSTMFAQVVDDCDWQAVLDYAARAAAAETLLVDPGPAQSFAFDPVHDHERASVPLRMVAIDPLQDGRNDVHHALVLVGSNDAVPAYEARAYTDSGATRDYRLTFEGGRIIFADRAPGDVNATAARKILTPFTQGYLETLEVQRGEGDEAHSTIALSPIPRTNRAGAPLDLPGASRRTHDL